MTKSDLVSVVAEKTKMTKKDADAVVTAVLDTITETLVKGEKVQIVGFGTFEVRERAARKGVKPGSPTKETIDIPANTVPAFKAGKVLKEAVAK